MKQIEKSDVEKQESPGDYRLEQFSDELLPRLFKSPGSDYGTLRVSETEAPEFKEGITVKSCDLTMKTELIDLDDIQQSTDIVSVGNINLFIRNNIIYDIPGLITYSRNTITCYRICK